MRAKSLCEVFSSEEKLSSIQKIWSYYPIDKIVKVNLNEAFFEKLETDCLECVPLGSKLAIFGADFWAKKLFLNLMEDGAYNVCIIIAFATNKLCDTAEGLFKRIDVPVEKILKFTLPNKCGC